MAKSLRSKRKRKMRAEKRIVNAKKELVKLKEIAAKLHGSKDSSAIKEVIESNIPDVEVTECPMQVEDSSTNSVRAKVDRRINNQWMNQKKIKAIKSKIKRHNAKKARRSKSAGLSSRKSKASMKSSKRRK